MSKYLLFVVIGIILYLLWNSVDGLNVGDTCSIDDDCNAEEPIQTLNICNEYTCLCNPVKNICELTLPDIPISPPIENYESRVWRYRCGAGFDLPKINVPMDTNYSRPRVDNECDSVDGTNEIISACLDDCTTPDCRQQYDTHTFKQTCKFAENNSRQSTINSYDDFGYTKLDAFVDVNSSNTIFQEYVDLLNDDNMSFTFRQVHPTLNIRLNEYLLKVYIERDFGNGKHIKIIARGIFYCDGKIYYYISPQCEIRTSNSYAVSGQDAHKREQNAEINGHRALVNKFHFLQIKRANSPTYEIHLDFQKIKKSTVKYPGFYVNGNIDGEFVDDLSEQCKISFNYNTVEQFFLKKSYYNDEVFMQNIVSFLDLYDTEELQNDSYNGLQVYGNSDLMGEHFFRTHANIDIFNIWLLLHAPYDNKTLGFVRLEGNPEEVNRQIIEASQMDDDSEKISSLTTIGVPYLNLSSHKNIYTFQMNAGDALRFKAYQTPHFGRETQSGIRVSTEGRYALLPVVFDLNDVFKISRLSTVSRLSVKTGQFGNTPNVIPPYLPLTIYKWFQDEFDFILPIYDGLRAQGIPIHEDILAVSRNRSNISVEIFQMVLDNVPLHRYMDDTKKVIAITAYLVNGI